MKRALLLLGFLLPVALAPVLATDASAAGPGGQQQAARGWLGVSMENGGPEGVRVRHVVRGSPAEKAGLRDNDLLVRVDGAPVTTAAQVTKVVSSHGAGDRIRVVVSRGGGESTFEVTLDARPSSDQIIRMDKIGAFAPAWVGTTTTAGGPTSLASLRGRVVLLDFWAMWCGPCRLIQPKLSALQAKYGAQGLSVVGITTDELEQAAAFKERTQMRYPVVSDPNGETTSAYGVSGLPTLFVIDKRGVVRDVTVGYDPGREASLEALVQTLLAEQVAQK